MRKRMRGRASGSPLSPARSPSSRPPAEAPKAAAKFEGPVSVDELDDAIQEHLLP